MDNQIARFERLVEKLVEYPLKRLFSGELHPQELVAQLGRAMEDQAEGTKAPDAYRLELNPADYEALLAADPELAGWLAAQICLLAEQAELSLSQDPNVELVSKPEVPRQAVTVSAQLTARSAEHTQAMDREHLRSLAALGPDGSTYLIVGGQQHVPLARTTYTLGRSLDCDIVLSDPTVSRRHAQLRWRFGRYVVYDLGSRLGTRVNGNPVSESVLEPGDVLTLGAVDVIYGHDPDGRPRRQDDGSARTKTRPKAKL